MEERMRTRRFRGWKVGGMMGDRAQVALKDGNSKIYLYGHWIGSDIYPAIGRALKRAPDRHTDVEYLARVIFDEMKGDDNDTTGFGIGTKQHDDIEHAIAVLDCKARTVRFDSCGRGDTPSEMSFREFETKALAGELSEF